MRIRISWIVIGILVAVLWQPTLVFWSNVGSQLAPGVWTEKLREETSRASTYVLSNDRFVTLPLPKPQGPIRVLTNASMPHSVVSQSINQLDNRRWTYAVEFRFLTSHHKVIKSETYEFRSNCILFQDRRTGTKFTETFFATRKQIPLSTRPMFLNPGNVPNGSAYLQLKLLRAHPEIDDVVVRMYVPMALSDRVAQRWNRLSVEKRLQLARGNVYRPALLRDDERARLLNNQWQLVLPHGVPNVDYQTRKLYTLKENDGQRIDNKALPYGLPIYPDLHGTVPIPDGIGHLRFRFNARTPATFLKAPRIQINYHPHPFHALATRQGDNSPFESVEKHTHIIDSIRNREFTIDANGGIAEIVSNAELSVEVFWKRDLDSKWEAITPSPVIHKTRQLPPGSQIAYPISHDGEDPTPLRVSIRSLSDTEQEISWELLDTSGDCIRQGIIKHQPTMSTYDRMVDHARVVQCSDPAHRYFVLSNAAKSLRLTSLQGSPLISVHTRLHRSELERQFPNDKSPFLRSQDSRPAWFSILPTVSDQPIDVPVHLQPRPPQIRNAVLAGKFEWTDFVPQNSLPAREFLVQRDPKFPLRKKLFPHLYRKIATSTSSPIANPISTHEPITFAISESPASRDLQLFFRHNLPPGYIQLFVDEELFDRRKLHTEFGSLRFRAIPSNTSSIRFATSAPLEIYANGLQPNGPVYLKRLAYPITRGSLLSFNYERTNESEEQIGFRFIGKSKNAALRVRLRGIRKDRDTILRDWTYLQRTISIDADEAHSQRNASYPAKVVCLDSEMGASAERVPYMAHSFVVPIGTDINEQQFEVDIELIDGSGGFLSIYQLRDELPVKSSSRLD